jgi:hypothetical protein
VRALPGCRSGGRTAHQAGKLPAARCRPRQLAACRRKTSPVAGPLGERVALSWCPPTWAGPAGLLCWRGPCAALMPRAWLDGLCCVWHFFLHIWQDRHRPSPKIDPRAGKSAVAPRARMARGRRLGGHRVVSFQVPLFCASPGITRQAGGRAVAGRGGAGAGGRDQGARALAHYSISGSRSIAWSHRRHSWKSSSRRSSPGWKSGSPGT